MIFQCWALLMNMHSATSTQFFCVWQSLAWATSRLRQSWACHSQRRSGGCRGRPRRARWCRTTLGDHVVLRLVCVLLSLHLSSHTPRIAADRIVAQTNKKGPFRVLHVSKLGPETFLSAHCDRKTGPKRSPFRVLEGRKASKLPSHPVFHHFPGPLHSPFPIGSTGKWGIISNFSSWVKMA